MPQQTGRTFVPTQQFPSDFFDALLNLLASASFNFSVQIKPGDATTLQVPVMADANNPRVGISLGGRWRWIDAALERQGPGGAAQTFDVYVTSAADDAYAASGGGEIDNTNRTPALAIVASGASPAGVVLSRLVAHAHWNGATFDYVDNLLGAWSGEARHASRHASNGDDPITPGSIGAAVAGAAAPPTAHHATHEPGGSDALVLDNILRYGTHAARPLPSAALEGVYYLETDTNGGTVFQCQTSIWVQITKGITALPQAHASTHQPGGSDPMAVDAAAGTGSLRTLGRLSSQAAQGSDPAIVGPWAKDDTLQAGSVATGDFAIGGTLTAGSAITLAPGALWLPDASGLLQRHVRLGSGASGQVLGANPASNTSRVDVLYAVYAGPGQEPTYQYVAGAVQGAILGTGYSTAGAGAAPANSIPLALYVFSNSAGTTTITRYDRRSRAGGFLRAATRTVGDLTFTNTSFVAVDTARLQFRVECTGRPLRFTITATGINSTSSDTIALGLLEDGVAMDGMTGSVSQFTPTSLVNGNLSSSYTKFPTPGSHLYALAVRVNGGTGTLYSNAQTTLEMVIEELVRKDVSDNGSS